ncbi:hypothetical protein [Mammaliicoccus vitulinus]|uniref:hypothetical protein n=1 Tax=Mammaliicoccus vitulinus TaxID=71237 RepID=UPI00248CA55C|nr:hypothetical protein [Mammaliicoccus vitulinus]
MRILGLKNFTPQTVLTGGTVNLGSSYRRFDKKNNCGIFAFSDNGTSVTLNQSGMYHITVTATFTAPAAGDVTLQLYEDGQPISGALATESITTATTEFRSVAIDYFIKVDKDFIMNTFSTDAASITLVNTGVGATITNVAFNVEKVD